MLAEGAGQTRPYQPFFSPDGKWLGFVTPETLNKLPVGGGTPIKLCDVDRARGVSWGENGTIAISASPRGPLMQVSDKGGELLPLTELDESKNELTHRWPQWLPGDQAVLFTSHTELTGFDHATIEVFIPESGERRVIHQGGTFGRYVELEEGKGVVIYANGDSLFGIPYDARRLETTGSSVPLLQGVTSSRNQGSAQYDVAPDGFLVYRSGASGALGNHLGLMNRDGQMTPLWTEVQFTRNPRFSPDGKRVAFGLLTEGVFDIWLYDIDRSVPTRLTFGKENQRYPVWSPDGRYIYYSAPRDGKVSVFRKPSDGSGAEEMIYATTKDAYAMDISPDGSLLAVGINQDGDNIDIGLLSLDEGGDPRMLLDSQFAEIMVRFSPNGRWVTYVSFESGRPEVYVVPVEGGGKWQISSEIALAPVWSSDGRELFFRSNGSTFVVDVEAEESRFRAGRPRALWTSMLADTDLDLPYDVSPDGQFVVIQTPQGASPDSHEHLSVVLNWHDELRAIFQE